MASLSSPTLHHIPVLLDEVLHWLDPTPGKVYVDGTLGAGGHSMALYEAIQPGGTLISIDRDPAAIAHGHQRFTDTAQNKLPSGLHLVHQNYDALPQVLQSLSLPPVNGGILVDMGVASFHFDDGTRGFSFSKSAPLDMRLDPLKQSLTAADIVNTWAEDELTQLFSRYGEVRFAKTLVKAILTQREKTPFTDTVQFSEFVARILQGQLHRVRGSNKKNHHDSTHPATQVFQALRITVNDELGHIERFFEGVASCMAPGARLLCISFHSLEDRLVKHGFKEGATDCVCPPHFPVCQCNHPKQWKILTPKPILPSVRECEQNPRARSAKLRVVEKL